jgi:hypothetical protein
MDRGTISGASKPLLSVSLRGGASHEVNCKLTLLKSRIRKSALSGVSYPPEDAEDPRFSDYFGSMQSIVTSTGQNDSGLFETNLRDERYLPFEGAGVVSEWQLELPADPSKEDPRQFEYDTISDVILHLRYTARDAGALLRRDAVTNLKTCIENAQAVGSVRLFSVRHEFPTEWANFKSQQVNANPQVFAKLTLDLKPEHYPFWSIGRLGTVNRADLFAETTTIGVKVSRQLDGTGQDTLVAVSSLGKLKGCKLTSPPATPTEKVTLYFTDNSMEDICLMVAWGK